MLTNAIGCECSDPMCPGGHLDQGCTTQAMYVVRRIDMDDGETRFVMCYACANDALDSGIFALVGGITKPA